MLVHGSLSSATQWSGYDSLLPDLEIVAIDLPGHGTRSSEDFTTAGAIQAISAAVDQASGPVVLAGHSLGGYMAMLYAARKSGHIVGLALLGTTADPQTRLAVIYSGFARFSQLVNQDRLFSLRNAIARRFGVSQQDLPKKNNYQVLPDAWGAVLDDCHPHQLTRVGCPVVIINGQFDQMRLSEKRFSSFAGGAPVITVRHASHLAPLTHKREMASHLADFVSFCTTQPDGYGQ